MSLKYKLIALNICLIVLCTIISGQLVIDSSKQQILTDQSLLLNEMASGMASRLGQDMNTRAAEIEFLTNMNTISDPSTDLKEKNRLFTEMKRAYPYYAWIGMTDKDGNILTGTDGLLVGKNVAKRRWFIEGSKGLHFGDAHDAFLLAKLMPKPKWDDLPLRLVDVSAPILDDNGQLLGVICGHLSVDWAFEARMRMLGNPDKQAIDLIVLNDQGKVLMGTPFLPSLKTDLSSLSAWQKLSINNESETLLEIWPDGQYYLTSAVSKQSLQSRLAINWTIIARKPEIDIFAATSNIQTIIYISGAILAILSSLLIIVLVHRNND